MFHKDTSPQGTRLSAIKLHLQEKYGYGRKTVWELTAGRREPKTETARALVREYHRLVKRQERMFAA